MAWVPFGRGPRNCIGFALAQMELTLIISRVAQRLDITATADEAPRPGRHGREPACRWRADASLGPMNGHLSDDVTAGHRVYTKRFLSVYDLVVLGWFSTTAWCCRAAVLTGHYDTHVSANHVDVGVGTGYFLDRCTLPTPRPRLALMDLNPSCLNAASRRMSRFEPETHVVNVLEPIAPQLDRGVDGFDSIGMTYLLHCLPGDMTTKVRVFENLLVLANPGATVFGATLLSGGVTRNWYARQVMAFNNKRGIFSNAADDLAGFEAALDEHLDDASIRIVGCVAVFAGTARTRAIACRSIT